MCPASSVILFQVLELPLCLSLPFLTFIWLRRVEISCNNVRNSRNLDSRCGPVIPNNVTVSAHFSLSSTCWHFSKAETQGVSVSHLSWHGFCPHPGCLQGLKGEWQQPLLLQQTARNKTHSITQEPPWPVVAPSALLCGLLRVTPKQGRRHYEGNTYIGIWLKARNTLLSPPERAPWWKHSTSSPIV